MTLDMAKTKQTLAAGGQAQLDAVTKISVGVSWDAGDGGSKGLLGKLRRKKGQDLDLVAAAIDSSGAAIRLCGPGNLEIFGGAMRHSGDEQSGAKEGVDEEITVDLAGMRSDVEGVVFAVTAMKIGSSFAEAQNVDVQLFDRSNGAPVEMDLFSPPINTTDNVILFCVVDRSAEDPAVWNVRRERMTLRATKDTLISALTRAFQGG